MDISPLSTCNGQFAFPGGFISPILTSGSKDACDVHILVPPLKEAPAACLGHRLSTPCASRGASCVAVGERRCSQPSSCDSSRRELLASRRLGYGAVRRQSDASLGPHDSPSPSTASTAWPTPIIMLVRALSVLPQRNFDVARPCS